MPIPHVTVVILHWRTSEQTERCLTTAARQTYLCWRLLLVDNGSGDGSGERLRAAFPQAELLTLPENYGFAGGMNRAIRWALAQGTDAVLLLNSDMLIPPDLIQRLVETRHRWPQYMLLSPKLSWLDRSGRLAGLGYRFGRYDVTVLGWDVPDEVHTDTEPVPIDAVFGSALFMTREVLERVGLFDERFFFYYEDIDYGRRAAAAGYQAAYLPDVTAQHAVAASVRRVAGLREFYLAQSRQRYFRKYLRGRKRLIYSLIEPMRALWTALVHLRFGEFPACVAYLAGTLIGLVEPQPYEREKYKV